MSDSIVTLLDRLERVAGYAGPWRPLRDETELLAERLRELRERERRLDDLLVVALVGGSGVGKSTLLNALAGDLLAPTSEFRPCTSVPTVYHPPGAQFEAGDWRCVSGSALEHLVLIDTPDSDTIVGEHRETVQTVLEQCDLVLICASPEKYLDEATWSLLRPLKDERTMACVETKAGDGDGVRDHWLDRLSEEGFHINDYFRVNALHALDHKLGEARGETYDFPKLETFLQHELTRERILRIKRSNAVGLFTKTLTTLHERVGLRQTDLAALAEKLDAKATETVQETRTLMSRELFAEPHLWAFVVGREAGLRAKGVVGTLFRLVEWARTLPARVAGWLPWRTGDGAGRHAANLLADSDLFRENAGLSVDAATDLYLRGQSELALAFARAGFEAPAGREGLDRFLEGLERRVSDVLQGPARRRVVSAARVLTNWPVALLADAGPLAFMAYTGYNIVKNYIDAIILDAGFFLHAAAVLGIVLVGELLLFSIAVRGLAWTARAGARRDLRAALSGASLAYLPERGSLAQAQDLTAELENLYASTVAGEAQP